MNTSQYKPPTLFVIAAAILLACIIIGILYADIFRLTAPEETYESDRIPVSLVGNPQPRCATISSVHPAFIPGEGDEIGRTIAMIYFTDNRDAPVLSEILYAFTNGQTYLITTEKRSDGRTYLVKARIGCQKQAPKDSGGIKNFHIRPIPTEPPIPLPPIFFSGGFLLIFLAIF